MENKIRKCSSHNSIKTPLFFDHFYLVFDLRTLFTFETADSTFNRKPRSESLNDYASFDERFYNNFRKKLYIKWDIINAVCIKNKVTMSKQVKQM